MMMIPATISFYVKNFILLIVRVMENSINFLLILLQ